MGFGVVEDILDALKEWDYFFLLLDMPEGLA